MNIVPYILLYFVVMMVVSVSSVSFSRYLYRAAGVTPAQVRRAYFPGARRDLYLWLAQQAAFSRQFYTMLWLAQGLPIPLAVAPVGAIVLWLLHLEGYIWIVAVVALALTLIWGLAAWIYGRRVEADTRDFFYGIGPHPYIEQAQREGRKPKQSRFPTQGPRLGGGDNSYLSNLMMAIIPIVLMVLLGLVLMIMQGNGS